MLPSRRVLSPSSLPPLQICARAFLRRGQEFVACNLETSPRKLLDHYLSLLTSQVWHTTVPWMPSSGSTLRGAPPVFSPASALAQCGSGFFFSFSALAATHFGQRGSRVSCNTPTRAPFLRSSVPHALTPACPPPSHYLTRDVAQHWRLRFLWSVRDRQICAGLRP